MFISHLHTRYSTTTKKNPKNQGPKGENIIMIMVGRSIVVVVVHTFQFLFIHSLGTI